LQVLVFRSAVVVCNHTSVGLEVMIRRGGKGPLSLSFEMSLFFYLALSDLSLLLTLLALSVGILKALEPQASLSVPLEFASSGTLQTRPWGLRYLHPLSSPVFLYVGLFLRWVVISHAPHRSYEWSALLYLDKLQKRSGLFGCRAEEAEAPPFVYAIQIELPENEQGHRGLSQQSIIRYARDVPLCSGHDIENICILAL
jgi:hypothetical protein